MYISEFDREKLRSDAGEELVEQSYRLLGYTECTECSSFLHETNLIHGLCPNCRCPECGAAISSKDLCFDMARCLDLHCGALMLYNMKTHRWSIVAYRDDEFVNESVLERDLSQHSIPSVDDAGAKCPMEAAKSTEGRFLSRANDIQSHHSSKEH